MNRHTPFYDFPPYKQEHHMDENKPDQILKFFKWDHLPEKLQAISKPFGELAYAIVGDERGLPAGASTTFPLPRNAERSVALRKLLEAKDAAVRAALPE